jgi:hypothetical protein
MAEAARNLAGQNIPTSLTVVLTSGTEWAAKAQIIWVHIANKTDAEIWVTMILTKGGVDQTVISQKPIPARDFLSFTTLLILESGDAIKLQAQSTNSLDYVFSGYDGVA